MLAISVSVDGDPIRVETPDPATVVVTLPHPFGPGIRLLDNLVILPKHRLESALDAGSIRRSLAGDQRRRPTSSGWGRSAW